MNEQCNACLGSLLVATYATSVENVCFDGIVSGEQGWNDKDDQVWGAEKGGYIFKKKQ